jgi:hypothetical protein
MLTVLNIVESKGNEDYSLYVRKMYKKYGPTFTIDVTTKERKTLLKLQKRVNFHPVDSVTFDPGTK